MKKESSKRKIVLFILGLLTLMSGSNAIAQQETITIYRSGSACDRGISSSDGFTTQVACSISFMNLATNNVTGVIWAKNEVYATGTTWRSISVSYGGAYSLQASGRINQLSFSDAITTIKVGQEKEFQQGYYIIKSPSGLYWAAYLIYRSDGYMTWGLINDPQHPWQICSANDTFTRHTGCVK